MAKQAHKHKEKHPYNWLPDFVYGGIDGAVTTFAIVAGVVGAQLSTPVILILGVANLLADGLSMAVGKYSSDKAEVQRIRAIKKDEERSIEEKPKEEREELRQILREFGFRGKDLRNAQSIITKDPETWVHLMLHHEFHIVEENVQPVKGGFTTFASFVLIGMIPLLAYTVQLFVNLQDRTTFVLTAVFTLIALFTVGSVKTRFTEEKWFLGGIETAATGGVAAAIAYGVGALLGHLFGVR